MMQLGVGEAKGRKIFFLLLSLALFRCCANNLRYNVMASELGALYGAFAIIDAEHRKHTRTRTIDKNPPSGLSGLRTLRYGRYLEVQIPFFSIYVFMAIYCSYYFVNVDISGDV